MKKEKNQTKQILSIVVLLITTFLSTSKSHSQTGITSYNLNVLALNFDIHKSDNSSLVAEIKQFADYDSWKDEFGNTSTELDLHFKFKKHEYHRFSVGFGFNVDFFNDGTENAVVLPIGLEVFPIPNFKKVSIQYELAPMYFLEDNFRLRNLLGIRYSFGK